MSIENVLRSMRALRAWQDASTPPIRIGAWRVLPWVEPVEFERVEDGLHPHMHVVRPPNPVLATAIAEEPRAELLRPDVLVAMQWKLGNRVATVYRAEADDARVSGALALFALAIRFFAWVEDRVRLPWTEPVERGVAGMRCESGSRDPLGAKSREARHLPIMGTGTAKLRAVSGVESKREREDREADEENAAQAEVVRVCRRMSPRGRLEYFSALLDAVARASARR